MGVYRTKTLPLFLFAYLKVVPSDDPRQTHLFLPQLSHHTLGLTAAESRVVAEYHAALFQCLLEIVAGCAKWDIMGGADKVDFVKETVNRLMRKVRKSREDWDGIRVVWQDEYTGRFGLATGKASQRRELLAKGLVPMREVFEFGEGSWADGKKVDCGLMVFDEGQPEASEGWL